MRLPPILTREQAGQHLPLYHWGYTKRAPQKCTQWMLVTQNQMRGRLAGSAHSAWDFQCQDPEFKPYTGQGAYLKKKKIKRYVTYIIRKILLKALLMKFLQFSFFKNALAKFIHYIPERHTF